MKTDLSVLGLQRVSLGLKAYQPKLKQGVFKISKSSFYVRNIPGGQRLKTISSWIQRFNFYLLNLVCKQHILSPLLHFFPFLPPCQNFALISSQELSLLHLMLLLLCVKGPAKAFQSKQFLVSCKEIQDRVSFLSTKATCYYSHLSMGECHFVQNEKKRIDVFTKTGEEVKNTCKQNNIINKLSD